MAETAGFLDSLKKLGDKPTSWYVELAGFLIAGFVVGFLLKHAGRFFLMLLLGAALALWALDYLQIITIHMTVLKSVLGMSPDMTSQQIIGVSSEWVSTHIIECLVSLFGFILAWKFA